MKLVSIITPTIPSRRELLLSRCVPSVAAQSYSPIEHLIIQDGPGKTIPALPDGVRYIEMGRNWRSFLGKKAVGGPPRNFGTLAARGDYIGYLDDDDEFLPQHVEKLVSLLETGGFDFVFSQFQYYLNGVPGGIVGNGKVEFGKIGTPMVVHKVECLLSGNWHGLASGEDYHLFHRWKNAGLKYGFVPEVTVKVCGRLNDR